MALSDPTVDIRWDNFSVKVSSDTLRANSQYFDGLFRFTNSAQSQRTVQLDEPLSEALGRLLADLSAHVAANESVPSASSSHCSFQQQSLEQLFDCILLSSKYRCERLEQHYSRRLVAILRQCAANFKPSDVIPPPDTPLDGDASLANYLSLLGIRRLAQAYQLSYLQARLYELIEEKRAIARRQLQRLFY